MSHDLVTIYWLKAIEYLLALSYLPLFVVFWRLLKPARPRPAEIASRTAWAEQLREYFQPPADLFFHPGHTWVRVEDRETATIGVDVFARQLVGRAAAFGLPPVGHSLSQGAPALAMTAQDRTVELLSPVDGTVTAVNGAALEAPAATSDAPYTAGWLLKVKSPRLAIDLKNLLSADLAHRWMDATCERLGAEMDASELGQVYADGGAVVDGIAPSLSPGHWDEVARRYFLTERGGADA